MTTTTPTQPNPANPQGTLPKHQLIGGATNTVTINQVTGAVTTGALASATYNGLPVVGFAAQTFNNGTLSSTDKAAITAEVAQLSAEISRIATQTKFNGNTILAGGTMTFQIGADYGQTLTVSLANLMGGGATYAVDGAVFNFASQASAGYLLASLDTGEQHEGTHRFTISARQQLRALASALGIREIDRTADGGDHAELADRTTERQRAEHRPAVGVERDRHALDLAAPGEGLEVARGIGGDVAHGGHPPAAGRPACRRRPFAAPFEAHGRAAAVVGGRERSRSYLHDTTR